MVNEAPHQANVAAVDLGSNSFHMVIGRFLDHDLRFIDKLKEPVRLAGGLGAKNRLHESTQERALDCLRRFGERVRDLPQDNVRAVGTNTLRIARNARSFLDRAREALGHPIEIISGEEEARLIYLGVAHDHPQGDERRLVLDIGGGSTEVILGQGFEVLRAHSLYMGCVTFSEQFFPKSRLKRKSFELAEMAARLELRSLRKKLRRLGWSAAVGASGTVHAVSDILRQNGWTNGSITLDGLRALQAAMVEARTVDKLALEGLKPERAPVLAGGLAILAGVFESLKVRSMDYSAGALREGVLYDLVGRIRHEDVRDRTIRRFLDQYQVDEAQAARVERAAIRLLTSIPLESEQERAQARKALTWAARLHEIGLSVSYTGYHRHGAYLLANSHMPGFARDDQGMLATLVRTHRRKLRPALLVGSTDTDQRLARKLCVVFRLAVLIHRGRSTHAIPALETDADVTQVNLRFPPGWLEQHPMTSADLRREVKSLRSLGVRLQVAEG